MEANAGPLPRLKMDGAENADQVVAAIATYKVNHTREETEKAVRIWYERYDKMLAAAIQENLDLKTLRDENPNNGYELCQQSQDYQHCQSRRMAEARGAPARPGRDGPEFKPDGSNSAFLLEGEDRLAAEQSAL